MKGVQIASSPKPKGFYSMMLHTLLGDLMKNLVVEVKTICRKEDEPYVDKMLLLKPKSLSPKQIGTLLAFLDNQGWDSMFIDAD